VLTAGQRVVVIDDLISTGGSVLNAVRAVQQAGGEVVGVIAVFSYQLPAADQNFAAAGLNYYAVTNYPTLINVAKEDGLISAAHLSSLQDWRQDPAAWSAQHAN
jgi:orotate phosphoribosyltransferase